MTAFPAVRIEGGLFAPDLFDQLLAEELPGQKLSDFKVKARRSLTDTIAGVFADAGALWQVFQHRLQNLPDSDLGTSVTRDAWVIPFLGLLGYELEYNRRAYEAGGMSFAVSHRAGDAEYAPPVHIVGVRQELGRVAPSGRPRLAPHSLVQEFLNRTETLWGLVTNGKTLRLLRDSTYIRRQCYVEFDLEAILEQRLFQDFAVLYRLLHRTRLPQSEADAHQCLLEQYYQHSVEQGGRVRDRLRDGVEECIMRLANGFLRHPKNEDLRRRVQAREGDSHRIAPEELYRQLLRLVYRFLFLMVAEDRGLLSTDPLYREHYSIGRLRRLVDQRAAYTEHDDLWLSLRVLWKLLADDQPVQQLGGRPLASLLGLPVLNGELFEPVDLDNCRITNRDLLDAFWHLAYYRYTDGSPPRRVNYAALDTEELGSVYESLLEFHPTIECDGSGRPVYRFVAGSERKSTGSYYTPPDLVGELIKSALEPVLEDWLKSCTDNNAKEKAILSMRVCDPACGSGHFLLAAARRLGKELARVRTGEDEPAPERVREAIRDVISHCIYGVDKNPLAVDLCRVALWLEGHTSDKPLTFLDHRIRCGDSLVGVFDLQVLMQGIPDGAFTPLAGDDKETARRLKAANKAERRDLERGQMRISFDVSQASDQLVQLARELDKIADDSPESIRRKKQLYERARYSSFALRQRQACDLWTAAFFQRLTATSAKGQAAGDDGRYITTYVLAEHLSGGAIDPRVLSQAQALAFKNRFFHWPLEFPEVFADGGFDVVLGNPPWEQIQFDDREFFETTRPDIVRAPNMSRRKKMIQRLAHEEPQLYESYIDTARQNDALKLFIHTSGRFPLTSFGRLNMAPLFAELCRRLIRPVGRSGVIVPTGIATDSFNQYFFQDLIEKRSLVSLYDFENRRAIFPGVHRSYKFCLLTMTAVGQGTGAAAKFAFFLYDTSELKNPDRCFRLSPEDIALLNPNTRTCPIFRSRADAELTKAIYRRVPVLVKEARHGQPEENPWGIKFKLMFMMNTDSHRFRTREELEADGFVLEGNVFRKKERTGGGQWRVVEEYLPLYEAKMIHQFDHRWATYEGTETRELTLKEKQDPNCVVLGRYWVRRANVDTALANVEWNHQWLIGWRDITNSTNERTAISSVWPRYGAGDTFLQMFTSESAYLTALNSACLNSFVADFNTRQKIGGTHLKYHYLKQIAILKPTSYGPASTSLRSPNVITYFPLGGVHNLLSRVLELTYTAWDLEPFARDVLDEIQTAPHDSEPGFAAYWKLYSSHSPSATGRSPPPFIWDEERRFWLRAELDAMFFHLYLPADADGEWRIARREDGAVLDETPQQLVELKHYFPTPRDAVEYIMETFPIVKRKDIARYGTYRTKEAILEVYDAMQESIRTGRPYQTRLDPPPADPRVAHR